MPVVSVASLQQQMLRGGVRRVLVFSGEADWCVAQALEFSGQSAGTGCGSVIRRLWE
jgi:tRNA(Met) cytidine acetyltransferase